MKAVIYAAKSTEDVRGSIPGQIEECRAFATAQGLSVVEPPEQDESASAFKGNRGGGLERAMERAEALAREHGEAAVVIWHSNRLARGELVSEVGAKHLIDYMRWAARAKVTIRSVLDDATFTNPILGFVVGEMNSAESALKGKNVSKGLRSRKERGDPVGPVPFGFTVEQTIIEGNVVTRRVVDSVNGPIVVWIFERVVAGKSTGEIARRLNADGVRTQRGKGWIHRRVRELIDNAAYEGKRGYPAIVDADLARRARERLTRMDPAAVQQRKGGRPPSPAFVLRSVLFCACGAPMYTSQKAQPRAYVCRDVVQCTGLCTRPRIPAQLIEGHVLRHLDAFVGKDLEAWIAERLATRTDEQATLESTLDARRSELASLDRRREKRMGELDSVGITKVGIEVIERIDAEREALATTIADIEARLSEFAPGPTSDAILDYYVSIRDAVTGRIAEAKGPSDVAAVLADVFEGIWAELTEPDFVPLTPDERSLRATFVLRRPLDNLRWLPAGEPIRDDDPIAIPWGLKRDVLPPLPKPDARGSCTSSR
jgi:DNA invertase Pin-like site-specific DNA recombinase